MINIKTIEATLETVQVKLLFSLKWASFLAIPIAVLEYYIGLFTQNKVFVILFFSSFVADVFLGIWKHLKLRTFDFSLLMWGAFTKLTVAFLAFILFNGLASVEGVGETGIKIYILLVGKILVLLYVDGSAFNNMSVITNGKFPPKSWMNRMKGFNETLDTSVFTNKSVINETNNTQN